MRVYQYMYIQYKSATAVIEVYLPHKIRIMGQKHVIRINKSYNNPRRTYVYTCICMNFLLNYKSC